MPKTLKEKVVRVNILDKREIQKVSYSEEFLIPGDEETIYHSVMEENPKINSVLIRDRRGLNSRRMMFGSVVQVVEKRR